MVADGKNPLPDQFSRRDRWSPGDKAVIIAAIITAIGAVIGSIVIRSGDNGSSSTTAATLKSGSTAPTVVSPPPTTLKQPPKEEPTAKRSGCLQSSSHSGNSMGTAIGPLVSGRRYPGTILAEDEDWLGFCVSREGEVNVTFENSCYTDEGPNDIYAELVTPGETEGRSIDPIPGRSKSLPLEARANVPYFVHIYDLQQSDIGSHVCGKLPWALTITGPLASTITAP
jgi:hypothetical protein